jgi:hypothetical protein
MLCLLIISWTPGCAQFSEKKSIQQFHTSMTNHDVNKLKELSSTKFNEKVLRHQQASEDLNILKIPQGKLKIVEVEDISPEKKHVTVEISDDLDRKTKVLYELVRMPVPKDEFRQEKWVVNELYLRQKKDGVDITKSITEQMDLLISVREFLQKWGTGERDAILESTGPELKQLLAEMPPSYLAKMTGKVSGAYQSTTVFRPQAEINGEYAVVKLPLRNGSMVLSMAHENEKWMVQDLAIDTKDAQDKIGSLKQMAKVINTAGTFLTKYQMADKKGLEQLASKDFYQGCIDPSDLSIVPLPQNEDMLTLPDIKIEGLRADFTLQGTAETVHISLVQQSVDKSANGYVVDNVTLYDNGNEQRKNLSAMLTSRAVALLLCETLQNREIKLLKQLSTTEMNEAIWHRLHQETFNLMPLEKYVPAAEPEIITTKFRGAVTEVTMRQGSQPVVYILRETRGELLLDDIQTAENAMDKDPELVVKTSFKQEFSGLVPIYEFVMALNKSDLKAIQQFSSHDFNNRIWTQTKNIPEIGTDLISHLMTPLAKIQHSPNEMLVTLGEQNQGARIHLVKEKGQFQINDAVLLGQDIQGNLAMKQAMRQQITFDNRVSGNIQTVSGQKALTTDGITTADHQEVAKPSTMKDSDQEEIPVYTEPKSVSENPLLQPIPVGP